MYSPFERISEAQTDEDRNLPMISSKFFRLVVPTIGAVTPNVNDEMGSWVNNERS